MYVDQYPHTFMPFDVCFFALTYQYSALTIWTLSWSFTKQPEAVRFLFALPYALPCTVVFTYSITDSGDSSIKLTRFVQLRTIWLIDAKIVPVQLFACET